MAQAERASTPMTVVQFRAWADRQPGRWELVDGQPRATAPASTTRGLIQSRACFLIERRLEEAGSPCRVVVEAPIVPASFRRSNARATDLAVTCSPPAEDLAADPVHVEQIGFTRPLSDFYARTSLALPRSATRVPYRPPASA